MATPQPLRLSLLITGDGDQLTATLRRVDNELHRTGAAGQAAGAQIGAGMRTAETGLHGVEATLNTLDSELHRTGAAGQSAGAQINAGLRSADIGLRATGQGGQNAGNQIHGGLQHATGGVNTLRSSLIGLQAAFLPLLTLAAVIGIADKIKEDSAVVQDLNTRLHTLTKTGLSFAESQAYINQVADDQHKDLLVLSGSYASLRNLQNSGVITGQQTQGIFEGINNAATALGAGNEQLKQTFFGLAQGLAAGTLRAEELTQVTEPMPGLLQELDKAANLSAGGFRKLVNDGKVTSEMFANTLVKALHAYDGAAAATGDNIHAMEADTKNSWTRLIITLEGPVGSAYKPLLTASKNVFDGIRFGIEMLTAQTPTAEQAIMSVQGVNISAANATQAVWIVTSNAVHDAFVALGGESAAAALASAAAWINSGADILGNTKTVANFVIGVFVGAGDAIGTVFAVMALNVQRSFANVAAYARATALDVANAAQFDFSFSTVKNVKPQPLINGTADVFSGLKKDLSADYLGDFAAKVQGTALGLQKLTDEQQKSAASSDKAKQAANGLTSATHALNGATASNAAAHGKASQAKSEAQKASESLHKSIAAELRSLDDQHAKLTLSERDYYAQSEALKGMTFAEKQLALAKFDIVKADEATKKSRDDQKSELESLTDQYKKLTLSARDYYLETLKNKGIKGEALQTDIAQFDTNTRLEKNNKELDDARQRIEGYGQSVRDLSSDFNGLGNTSSSVFDAQLGGLNAVAGAFGNLFVTLDKTQIKMDELAKKQADVANFKMADPAIDPEQYVKDLALRDQKLKDLAKEEAYYTKQNTAATLAGTRQMAGAFSDMFAENSAGRKGFHALEMTLGAAEVAYNLYANAQTIASNGVAMVSNISTAATKIWSQLGIFAPIGLAAMAASLVAYGVGAVGGSSIAEPPKSSPDTGTVLGDSTAQSNSVDNLFKLLQDIHASEYAELRGINSGVNDLQTALSGTITRLFQAGGLDTSNKGIDLSYGIGDSITRSFTTGAGLASTIISTGISTGIGFAVSGAVGSFAAGMLGSAAFSGLGAAIGAAAGPIGLVASGIFSLVNMLFSGGYRDVTERGIQTKSQTLGDVVGGSSLNAMQYNVIKTREWDLFSDSTRFDTVFNKLDGKVVDSLTNVFESAGSVSLMLANSLGGDLSDRVKNYVLPELKIDLTKLNAEDASKKLNAVISTTLDTMANDLFAGVVGEYQQIGEGMLETAARIVAEVSVVKSALNTSGLSISGDTIKISDSLVQLAGGIKAFQDGFSGYYDKFYTDAEKQAQLQASLTSSLGELFMALPATRQGYRDVLEALNLNNEADQKRYTLLIQLSGAADSYYKSLESGLKTLEDGVKSAFDTAAGLLQKQVDNYRGFANQFKTFSDSLLMTAANPQQKYDLAKTAFVDIRAVLDSSTSTTEQKDAALAQLQSVTQTYLDASRAYNGSSLDYFKDFAEAQALLAKEITANNNKADLAQSQLDKLTEQVTALGLINTSVLTVDSSVRALTIAMAGLVKAKETELQVAADNANRAVFNKNEAARKSAYETPIANKASAIGGIAQKQEDRIGWSGNSSKRAFGASGSVDPSTGNSTSQVSSYAHSGDVNNVIRHQLDNAKGQFSAIGKMIQNIIGGDLPDVFISLKSDGRDRDAFESYTFNGQTRTLKSYDIDPLVRLFAKDSVDYLANNLADKTWADQLKKINFASIGGGMSDLSSLMDHLRNPFKDATYDPNKVYVDGSHRAGLDYVPRDGYIAELHQGERVLTAEQAKQSRVIVGPDNQEGIDRLIRANKELSNQHRADADKHTQDVIATLVEGIRANVKGQAALEKQLMDVNAELVRTRRELAQARVAG